ncbi:hypothetical protein ACOIFA_28430, partial [Klebsiella pneumoniae]
DTAFDADGRQIHPLIGRLTGNVAGLVILLNKNDRHAESDNDISLSNQYRLIARNGLSGWSN